MKTNQLRGYQPNYSKFELCLQLAPEALCRALCRPIVQLAVNYDSMGSFVGLLDYSDDPMGRYVRVSFDLCYRSLLLYRRIPFVRFSVLPWYGHLSQACTIRRLQALLQRLSVARLCLVVTLSIPPMYLDRYFEHKTLL